MRVVLRSAPPPLLLPSSCPHPAPILPPSTLVSLSSHAPLLVLPQAMDATLMNRVTKAPEIEKMIGNYPKWVQFSEFEQVSRSAAKAGVILPHYSTSVPLQSRPVLSHHTAVQGKRKRRRKEGKKSTLFIRMMQSLCHCLVYQRVMCCYCVAGIAWWCSIVLLRGRGSLVLTLHCFLGR